MSGSKKITAFFSPSHCKKASSKRPALNEVDCNNESSVPPSKLLKSEKQPKLCQPSSQKQLITKSMWSTALQEEKKKPYFTKLQSFVESERKKCTVYPPAHQVFSWTEHHDMTKTKVVILGQDPYHGPKQAHGLCFSVQKGVTPPPSLKNMYKELVKDIPGFVTPRHGDLSSWASQGVLLLNAVLTVRASQANSHKDKGWEKFTDWVISWVAKNLNGVVFMLWGSYAQKKCSRIDTKRHCVLKAVHPSPLSAHRGYFGCKHFSQANQYLVEQGKKPIDWCISS